MHSLKVCKSNCTYL